MMNTHTAALFMTKREAKEIFQVLGYKNPEVKNGGPINESSQFNRR